MSSNQPQLFQVRDERKPGHCWADNEIIDVFGPLIGAYGVAVYMAISRHSSNKTGQCKKTQGELAKALAISHDTVRRAIQKLVEHGLIIQEEGYLGKPCTYVLLAVPKERIVPQGQDDLPLIASGSRSGKDSKRAEETAKEITLIASAISTDQTLTALPGKNDLPLLASTHTPTASGVTPTASHHKEDKTFFKTFNNTKPSESETSDSGDPRHGEARKFIQLCHAQANTMPPNLVPWDGREGKALASWLEKYCGATLEHIKNCVRNYYGSDVNVSDRPARWIPKLLEYWSGERNQYGTPRWADKDFQREQRLRSEANVGVYRP